MAHRHIAIVDGAWAGHHPVYVKAFVKVLLESGYRVSVFCPAPEEVEAWFTQTFAMENCRFKAYAFSESTPGIFSFVPSKIRYALSSLARWIHVAHSLKTLNSSTESPDLVFFAWMDSYLYGYLPTCLIDRIFPLPWSGLYFHPRHFRDLNRDAMPKKSFFTPPVNFIAQSRWAESMAVLDAGIAGLLRSGLRGKPVAVLPDFTDEVPADDHYHLAEDIKKKAKGRKIIGFLGGLSQRKGLLTLVRTVKQSEGKNWYFVFAGKLLEQTFTKEELEEIRLFFNSRREDCYFYLDRIQDDAQFNALVNICDVIFAMYIDFPHSSNLVTKSAIYGKSVLVSAGGYMEEVVRRYKLGLVVPVGDVQAAMGALNQLTAREHTAENLSGMAEYAGMQTQENLKRIFLDLIDNSINYSSGKHNVTG